MTEKEKGSFLGKDAPEVYEELILMQKNLRNVMLVKYSPAPLLSRRVILTGGESELVEKALDTKKATGLPFWDSLLLQTFEASEVPENVITGALFHQDIYRNHITVSWDKFYRGFLREQCEALEPGQCLALGSEVVDSKGHVKHWWMLDFHIPKGVRNLRLVESVCGILFPAGGLVLETDDSYHGCSFVPDNGLTEFLGRALLLSPIVDRSYIAHQLLYKRCSLRVSPYSGEGVGPQVVAVVS